MIAFYLLLASDFLNYSKSKYFPSYLPRTDRRVVRIVAPLLLIAGVWMYVYIYGWGTGLLMALAAVTLAMSLIRFFAVLGKEYFYGLAAVVHVFALLEVVTYAGQP